jgi:hypothetical protein
MNSCESSEMQQKPRLQLLKNQTVIGQSLLGNRGIHS